MAGNCLITVDQDYVDALYAILETYHANLSLQLRTRRVTGINKNNNATVNNLAYTSSVLLFLYYWNVSTDDCEKLHCLKEDMMEIYGFTEDDIESSFVTNGISTQSGSPFLTESEDKYLIIE